MNRETLNELIECKMKVKFLIQPIELEVCLKLLIFSSFNFENPMEAW